MFTSDDYRSEMMRAILDRAATDSAFRQALLDDPKRAIREKFGVSIPEEFRIRFVERAADVDALIVLPDMKAGDELTEADLESVAGGTTTNYTWAPPPPPPPPPGGGSNG